MTLLPAAQRLAFLAITFAFGAFPWGCDSLDGFWEAKSDNVRASINQGQLHIDNQRQDTTWTRQFGRRIRARILLAPPSIEREGVPPGEEKVIPLQEIPQDDNEEEVIVSWWEAVTEDGERRASEVRSLAVELP